MARIFAKYARQRITRRRLLQASGITAAVRQGAINRVASAVGQGGMVVSFVHQYLKTV